VGRTTRSLRLSHAAREKDVAELPALDERLERLGVGAVAVVHRHHQGLPGSVGRAQYPVDGLLAEGERLLDQHVLARFEGGDGLRLVQVAGRADHHRVQLIVRQHVLVGGVDPFDAEA
jgi:hypothetical protein